MDSLDNGQNIPTVLQSLGCLAQYSTPTFESHVQDIGQYIIKKFFQVNNLSLIDFFNPSLLRLGKFQSIKVDTCLLSLLRWRYQMS